jgi:hypothetical protein
MKRVRLILAGLLLLAAAQGAEPADPVKRSSKEALQAFNDLIGSWRASGTPEGTKAVKDRGFWSETNRWEWQFKKDEVWLQVAFDKGKHWRDGQLRYLADKDQFQLTLQNEAKQSLTFQGTLKERLLILEREDAAAKETQRFIMRLLHANRYLYQYEVKRAGQPTFKRLYQVGATKEGEPFAVNGTTGPECIVSGGPGTIKVTHKGQNYYVCCSGCKAAFQEEPEKYIKEFEAKKAKK